MKHIKSFNQKLIKESVNNPFVLQGDKVILPLDTDNTDTYFEFWPATTIKNSLERLNNGGLSLIGKVVDKKDDRWIFKEDDVLKGWYLTEDGDTFGIYTSKDIEGKNHNVGTWDIKKSNLNISNLKLMKYLTAIMVEKS
jgi:hypothetical protein